MITLVFDVIPYAVRNLEQLIAAPVGIVNTIPFPTDLNPPILAP
jgi:hypothetical protein